MEGRSDTKRSRSGSGSGSGSVAVLPINIIEKEILSRLPVKSILRCKSVCKLWYSVIKSPSFVTHHYRRQTRINPIVVERYPVVGSLPIVFNPHIAVAAKPRYVTWPMVGRDGVGGGNLLFSYYLGLPIYGLFIRPVNGFLVLILPNMSGDGCRMAMFNPATRQFVNLNLNLDDDFEFNTANGTKRFPPSTYNHIFGFGICKGRGSNTLVYKLVWLNVHHDSDVAIAKVYSIGDGDGEGGHWRTINAALPRYFVMKYSNEPNSHISMKGRSYWLSRDFSRILVFDMEEEEFKEMTSPVPVCTSNNKRLLDAIFSEVRCCGDEVTDSTILVKSGRGSLALYDPKTNQCLQFRQAVHEADMCSRVMVFNFKESLFYVEGGKQVSPCMLKKFSTF